MKRQRLIYEQLEKPKAYLISGSLFDLRLALILTDNVAELLMFNALESIFSRDDWLRPMRKSAGRHGFPPDPVLQPKYTDEERKEAEREFEPMVRLLQHRLAELSPSDATIVRIGHRLRRGAFHKGQLHEDILEPIVRLLFTTVVQLTQSLRTSDIVQTYPLSEEENAFLRRYDLRASDFGFEEARVKCAAKLLEDVAFDLELFRQTLIDDLVGRVQALINMLDYFYGTDEEKNEALLRQQFWKENAAQGKEVKRTEFNPTFGLWKAGATPVATIGRLRQFLASAPRKLNSRYASQILAGYWGLDKELEPREEFINDHIEALDEAIQNQIDILRGK